MKIPPALSQKIPIIGATLQIAPFFGLLLIRPMLKFSMSNGTILSLLDKISANDDSPGLGLLLFIGSIPVLCGLLLAAVGIILILVSLYSYRYRAHWFFWFLVIYGGIALFMVPIGTPFGALFIVAALIRRKEFFRENETPILS